MITGEKADLRQILTVRDLRVAYGQRGGGVWHALNGVSFGVGAGEIVAGFGGAGGGGKTVGGGFFWVLRGGGRRISWGGFLVGGGVSPPDAAAPRRPPVRGATRF